MKNGSRSVKQFTMPRLGDNVWRFEKPWKPTGFGCTPHGFMLCVCNNDSRRHSKVLLFDGKNVRTILDDTQGHSSNETIGNPHWRGDYVALVGENGNLWLYHPQVGITKTFTTTFANVATDYGLHSVVLDTKDGKLSVRDAMSETGRVLLTMPGDGIAMAACQYGTALYAAVADSETGNQGLSCSDGSLIKLPSCLCVTRFADGLVYSTMNQVHMLNIGHVATLDCEKIMDMKVVGNHIYIAGANPDSLWIANARGEVSLVGRIAHGNKEVGGSCFRVRVAVNPTETKGYFARTANGNQGEVYEIFWG